MQILHRFSCQKLKKVRSGSGRYKFRIRIRPGQKVSDPAGSESTTMPATGSKVALAFHTNFVAWTHKFANEAFTETPIPAIRKFL
jgi:hypothetical protein